MAGMTTCFVIMIVSSKVSQITHQFTDAFNNVKDCMHTGSCNSGAVAIAFLIDWFVFWSATDFFVVISAIAIISIKEGPSVVPRYMVRDRECGNAGGASWGLPLVGKRLKLKYFYCQTRQIRRVCRTTPDQSLAFK